MEDMLSSESQQEKVPFIFFIKLHYTLHCLCACGYQFATIVLNIIIIGQFCLMFTNCALAC
jgi:hypothetical protein